jgi:Tfp pilus assembly protein PilF
MFAGHTAAAPAAGRSAAPSPIVKEGAAAAVKSTRAPSAGELINEGLRQRQQVGTAAARPYFERAAQLEPNSHVPWFMLGNVASELGDLDAAVTHYEHARAMGSRAAA